MKPESFKTKSEQIDPIREYSKEVLKLMYPEKGKGKTFIDAVKILANRKGIPESQVKTLMSKIGKYIKTHADLKRWEKEAVEVPVGKHLEPVEKSKEPHEDTFTKAERLRHEKIRQANPLFPEFEEAMLDEKARKDFN